MTPCERPWSGKRPNGVNPVNYEPASINRGCTSCTRPHLYWLEDNKGPDQPEPATRPKSHIHRRDLHPTTPHGHPGLQDGIWVVVGLTWPCFFCDEVSWLSLQRHTHGHLITQHVRQPSQDTDTMLDQLYVMWSWRLLLVLIHCRIYIVPLDMKGCMADTPFHIQGDDIFLF